MMENRFAAGTFQSEKVKTGPGGPRRQCDDIDERIL
jgi:hypothetical protein